MKYAIIDVGSNTIRLSVSEVENGEAKNLFQKKTTAGLASYVKGGAMGEAGIQRACDALNEFKELLSHFDIDQTAVFATASLRNISNSAEALMKIQAQTGYSIELLSGAEEAAMGYYGICSTIHCERGILLDIGGGSTEMTAFNDHGPQLCKSFPLGSLNLYESCVTKVLPKKKELMAMEQRIEAVVTKDAIKPFGQSRAIVAVGGSARAVLKLAKGMFDLPAGSTQLTHEQLSVLLETLCKKEPSSIELILKRCPDRVHTVIPGLMILETLSRRLGGETVEICQCGIREGYLWQKVL